jgi:bifunctional non-homologous end joining protein LigD
MARGALGEYRRKRDFAKTPEPDAGTEPKGRKGAQTELDGARGRFVVQQHDATNLHWDLRLEHDGVALSWALPRGVPQLPDRGANRLAVRTEDHPLSYLDFEGEIPAGEYGAGTMSIWDSGTYAAEKLREDEVIADFEGERMRGRYALFRTGGKNWMIHRIDPPLDPLRGPLPEQARPMLNRRGKLPGNSEGWGFEIAWGGLRSMLWCEPGHILRSRSRGLKAETVTVFPELRRIARALGSVEAVLDGEIVVLGEDGAPDRERLRARKRAGSEAVAKRLARSSGAAIMLFDLLFCDGRDLTGEPYSARRSALEELGLAGDAWQTPAYHRGDGGALLAAARERGLDGIVAKRLDSPYREGRRSPDWIKIEA